MRSHREMRPSNRSNCCVHTVTSRTLATPLKGEQAMRMGPRPSFIVGVACAALLSLGGAARANEAGELHVGIFGGFHIFSNTNELGTGPGSPDGPDSGPIFGLRLGYGLFSHFMLEAEGGVIPSHTLTSTEDNFI